MSYPRSDEYSEQIFDFLESAKESGHTPHDYNSRGWHEVEEALEYWQGTRNLDPKHAGLIEDYKLFLGGEKGD